MSRKKKLMYPAFAADYQHKDFRLTSRHNLPCTVALGAALMISHPNNVLIGSDEGTRKNVVQLQSFHVNSVPNGLQRH